ncbi:helical backbone metal receptor [Pseudomonas sp. ZM23]|uniref:Helical backbone metal receptor n=1 Tax=Pseudomonas triclosanedens TaxID=2961893 RepID=A0ABY6ZXR6_9PSED|nr:helical backbone metal receptor [Pseudomonas triclosanedens]MCP8465462.1 helical backbone metal receptor [Pseudomonas triclosanedens]MCP8470598.1 helical backbone metal receptor [Pseudomonas triclosanedens]MCP8476761.1 helical backbone metal receptor [Pseudomonas triclosanedens]WAI48790.1 helical backbone metal receptor [Pseudomonas triclosanedens]
MTARPLLIGLFTGLCLAASNLAAETLPKRWISAGGSLSEWVVALGGESRLVGVDTTSLHPASLAVLPRIGYQRQLAAEGILALKPDILLGSEEMGPPPVLQQLRAAGVRIETLSAKADAQTVRDTLLRLGKLLGAPEQAKQMAEHFQSRIAVQQARVTKAQATQAAPGVVLLVGQAGGNLLVAGQETSGDWMLRHAGGRNLAGHKGYKALSSEALTALDPQVIVLADRSLDGDAARTALTRQNPALSATRGVREGRVVILDPTLLVGGLGPRVPDGLASLSRAFYPSAQALNSEGHP